MSLLSGFSTPISATASSIKRAFHPAHLKTESPAFMKAMLFEVSISVAGQVANLFSETPFIGIATTTFYWWTAARTAVSMLLISLLLPSYHKPQIDPLETKPLSEDDRKDRVTRSVLLNTLHYLMLRLTSKIITNAIPCLSSPIGICILLATQALFQGFVLAQYGMSRDGLTANQMVKHACHYPLHLIPLGMVSSAPTWIINYLMPQLSLLQIPAEGFNQLWQLKCLMIAGEYRMPGIEKTRSRPNKIVSALLEIVNPLSWMWTAILDAREKFRRPPQINQDAKKVRRKFDAVHELSLQKLINSALDVFAYVLFKEAKLTIFNGMGLKHVTTDIADTLAIVSDVVDENFDIIKKAKAGLKMDFLNISGRIKQFAQSQFKLTKGQTDAIHFFVVAVDTTEIKRYLAQANRALARFRTEDAVFVEAPTGEPAPPNEDTEPPSRKSTPNPLIDSNPGAASPPPRHSTAIYTAADLGIPEEIVPKGVSDDWQSIDEDNGVTTF